MLKVNLSRQSAKFIKKLSTKHARQVAAKITQLISNTKMFATNLPPKSPSPPLVPPSGGETEGGLSEKRVLEILVIDKRNDNAVYKQLKRL